VVIDLSMLIEERRAYDALQHVANMCDDATYH
jgi:hypothetical protein